MQYAIGTSVFENWTIMRKIGEGSFGHVFEIQREDFGQLYTAALKIITVPQNDAEFHAVVEEGMTKAQAEEYFYSVVEDVVREFAIMARLKGTANVVNYEDHMVVKHEDGIGWDILIRMELLTPLLTFAYKNPFSRRDIIQLGIDMCRALELCQKYNIIHRDIKPENIFVSENGSFKLGDFGIARTIEKTTSGLSKKGTYTYMAPEVYRGERYDYSVDIYSLGIVLYRLLNKNRVPFLPPSPEPITYHAREESLAKRISGEEIPYPFYGEGRLAEIVLKACAFLPKERYSSPAQMRQELEAIIYDPRDAELIYPDGDELFYSENQYASQTPDSYDDSPRQDGQYVDETAKTESIFLQRYGSENLEESKTESLFGVRQTDVKLEDKTESIFGFPSSTKENQPVKPSKWLKDKSKKKKALISILLVVAVAASAIAFMIFRNNSETRRQEAFQQLMDEGTELCKSDPQSAGEYFLNAQELYPDVPAAYISYAYSLYCMGEYVQCVSYIEDTLALGKNYEIEDQNKLSEILGAAYFELDEYAAAASFFRLSTAGGDITVSAMRDYAVSLGRLGDYDAANEVLERMISAGADEDVTTYVQAEVNYALENYLEAESGFKTVLEQSDDIVLQKRSLRSLAEVYRDCSVLVRTHQSPIPTPATKEAELLAWGIAEYGLRYDSTIWEMLALAYFEASHTDETAPQNYLKKAAECFNRVIELGVTKDYLYANLYTVYYEMQDYSSAENALKEYEKQYPNSYMPHALRGMMLITVENNKSIENRNYSAAKDEYLKASSLIRSDDDATYFQQLESLIHKLEAEGWF